MSISEDGELNRASRGRRLKMSVEADESEESGTELHDAGRRS